MANGMKGIQMLQQETLERETVEVCLRGAIHQRLHPTEDELQLIYEYWVAFKHRWSVEEAAVLLMGASPGPDPDVEEVDLVEILMCSDVASWEFGVVPAEERKRFQRYVDAIRRRFGESIDPHELYKWATEREFENSLLGAALEKYSPGGSKPERAGPRKNKENKRDEILAAAAKALGYDPKKSNLAITKIVGVAHRAGLRLDRDTVSKHLKELTWATDFQAANHDDPALARRMKIFKDD
jgi:hypothetical protein